MSTITAQELLTKYHDIIAEEVNVKKVSLLPQDMEVTVSYVPLGQQLSAKFGKDTWLIIWAAKEWNVEPLQHGQIKVFVGDNERILERNEYEVRYHGLDETKQTVEEGVIVSLDLTITPELKEEGIAREFSRFLNQLRKEADYQVDDRVACYWDTTSDDFIKALENHKEFLMQEALLSKILSGVSWDISKEYESEEGKITFSLKK